MNTMFKKYLKKNQEVDNIGLFNQFEEMLKLGIPLPALHLIKQKTIQYYKEKFLIENFIETGTFLGDMVEAQRPHFSKIISIELSEDLYKQAVNRFSSYNHIKILQGDSGEKLHSIIEEISTPCIFWLDGHYSSGITAKGDLNTPIYEELRAILKSPINHVILIDDARLFDGTQDYPSINELCSFVSEKNKNLIVTVADDIIRIYRRK